MCLEWDTAAFLASFLAAGVWCSVLCPLSQKHDSVWIQGLCDKADSLRGSTGISGPAAGRLQHAAPELRPGLLWDGNWLQFSPCTSPRTRVLLGLTWSLLLQVCDTFLKYGLPLVVMPPAGVFYPALFATDPVSVDRLAYIMYRWTSSAFKNHFYASMSSFWLPDNAIARIQWFVIRLLCVLFSVQVQGESDFSQESRNSHRGKSPSSFSLLLKIQRNSTKMEFVPLFFPTAGIYLDKLCKKVKVWNATGLVNTLDSSINVQHKKSQNTRMQLITFIVFQLPS